MQMLINFYFGSFCPLLIIMITPDQGGNETLLDSSILLPLNPTLPQQEFTNVGFNASSHEVAPVEKSKQPVTLVVSHAVRFWLNAAAFLYMEFIASTDEVFQENNDWLKALAPWNIPFMFMTDDVSQASNGWLNAAASWNMASMVPTDDVSQAPNGWLNADALTNMAVI